MGYPATGKLEIIRTVDTWPLSLRRTPRQICIPKSTFCSRLDRQAVGALFSCSSSRHYLRPDLMLRFPAQP